MAQLEEIAAFFNNRVESYDDHMLIEEDLQIFYDTIGQTIPMGMNKPNILDLGCGTGLEINEIFKIYPDAEITCIDISDKMLEKLHKKFINKSRQLHLICASYFDIDYGRGKYDLAISTYSLHHFTSEKKLSLYQKIVKSLKPESLYIEGDYVVKTKEKEDYFQNEINRIRADNNLSGEFYHYDTPLAIETQVELFKKSCFTDIQIPKQWENTTIFVCKK